MSSSKEKLNQIEQRLKGLPSIALAFSGGVDSTFLLAVAKKCRPGDLLAVTVSCAFVPVREVDSAKKIAKEIGADHLVLSADILDSPEVAANPPDRCYHCKILIFSQVKKAAAARGIADCLHAVNADDLSDYRPGLKAADELSFIAPLAEAGLTKKEIRSLSKEMGLDTWDKPSQSCLATRIPYHTRITPRALAMVDEAEALLQEMGFAQVRVRCHGLGAKIEVEPHLVGQLMEQSVRQKISRAFFRIGFEQTSIDIDGFRSGKMNDCLKRE